MKVIRRTTSANDRLKIVFMRRFGWMVILTALAFHASAQTVVRSGALPPPLPLFPPNNWWNTDISGAPVDSNSAAFINFVGATGGLHPDFGGDSGDASAPIYGFPYVVVSGSQPLVPVTFDYADQSDSAAPAARPAIRSRRKRRRSRSGSKEGWPEMIRTPTAIGTCSSSIATIAFSSSCTRCIGAAHAGKRDRARSFHLT